MQVKTKLISITLRHTSLHGFLSRRARYNSGETIKRTRGDFVGGDHVIEVKFTLNKAGEEFFGLLELSGYRGWLLDTVLTVFWCRGAETPT